MNIPYICLSDRCEITDVSDTLKSLPNKRNGKDFLLHLFGTDGYAQIEEFCLGAEDISSRVIPITSSHSVYHEAVLVKCTYGGAIMYLLSKGTSPLQLALLQKEEAPADALDLVDHSINIGFSCSADQAFRRLCSRAAQNSLVEENLSGNAGEAIISANYTASLPTYYSSLFGVVTSLISAMVCVAIGGICLDMTSRTLGLELTISTDTFMIPPFTGGCHDIMSLSPYLRGSRQHLSAALLKAESMGFALSAVFTPDGKLSFTVSNISHIMPPPEFKLSTDNTEEAELWEILFDLMSSAQEQKHKEDQHFSAVLTAGDHQHD